MSELVAVKTSDLSGAALDWAVAIAEFGKVYVYPDGGVCPPNGTISMNDDDGSLWTNIGEFHHGAGWAPSADWSQGGPLIDKHRISFVTTGTGPSDEQGNEPIVAIAGGLNWKACEGKTHLIAACRAAVAAKLGDTVNVPKELLP